MRERKLDEQGGGGGALKRQQKGEIHIYIWGPERAHVILTVLSKQLRSPVLVFGLEREIKN